MARVQVVTARADVWSALAENSRSGTSERGLLEELLEILAGELGASRATFKPGGDTGAIGGVTVVTRPPGDAVGASLVVPVPSGFVHFDDVADASVDVDGPRRVALAAAVRAFDLSQHVKRQRFEVNYRGVELEALYDVGLAIAATLNLDELSEEILLRAVSLLDARRGAFYRRSGDDFALEQTFGGSASESLAASELEPLLTGQEADGTKALPGSRHLLAVPIGVEKRIQGLLVMADKESREGVGPFGSSDRRTLELFANQAAIALENAYLHRQALEKERLEREGELAAEIQRRLLPETTPDIAGFEVAGWNRPARLVGGDYYNYLSLEEGTQLLVLGDVTGKGMPAALLVSTLDSAIRLLLNQGLRGGELLSALNRHIWSSSAANTFITLVALEIDSERDRCRYGSAGHNPVVWLTREGKARELGATGLPIGLFRQADYEFVDVKLDAGDLLCLYSDGITECLAEDDEEFGLERLVESLAARRGSPLAETAAAICDQMTAFAAAGPRNDDQTVVLVHKS